MEEQRRYRYHRWHHHHNWAAPTQKGQVMRSRSVGFSSYLQEGRRYCCKTSPTQSLWWTKPVGINVGHQQLHYWATCKANFKEFSSDLARLSYQLPDWHLAEVTQTQVHFIIVDFILQVQHFAVLAHFDVWQTKLTRRNKPMWVLNTSPRFKTHPETLLTSRICL